MSRASKKGNPEQPRGSQHRVFGNKTKKKGREIMGLNDITLGFGGGGSRLLKDILSHYADVSFQWGGSTTLFVSLRSRHKSHEL